jgi:hypothetical protein
MEATKEAECLSDGKYCVSSIDGDGTTDNDTRPNGKSLLLESLR